MSLLRPRDAGLTEYPPDPQVKEPPGTSHPDNPAGEQDMVDVAHYSGSEVGLDQEQVPPRTRLSRAARGGSPFPEEPEIEKKAA